MGKTDADACWCAGDNPERAAEVCGAWLVLAQVAALDASAPSWEFLQVPDNSLSQPATLSKHLPPIWFKAYNACDAGPELQKS